MKKVFIRVGDSVSKEAAEKHMQSLGYSWRHVVSFTKFPEHVLNSLIGFTGHEDGQLCWFDEHIDSSLKWNSEECQEIFMPTNKNTQQSVNPDKIGKYKV